MSNIVVLCAMRSEAEAIPKTYPVVLTGVGFRSARAAAERAIAEYKPAHIVSAGTCGALDVVFALGDVVTVSKVLSPLGEFEAQALNGPSAVLYSQDVVVVTAAEKARLNRDGAGIVDMESAVIAEACQRHGIRFSCLKAVSDLATEDLPVDFNLYRDEAGHFQTARIAFAGIRKIDALLRLRRQSIYAATRLGEAFAHALS